jgi:large subunit ribosomal protein L24
VDPIEYPAPQGTLPQGTPRKTWYFRAEGVDDEPALAHSYAFAGGAFCVASRIRRGDLVQVIAGADRGKQGRVVAIDSKRGKLRVEKVRMQKRHLKAGRKGARTGGVIEQEGFIDASNVMLVDPATNQPSRVGIRREGDRKVRRFARSGDDVPEPVAT